MNLKSILLVVTISLAALPGVSNATACTDAMLAIQNALNDLNEAYASGNQKRIQHFLQAYFNAVEGANTVCENNWIGLE
jgi:hypothetical protein